jgi:hypothetical protein
MRRKGGHRPHRRLALAQECVNPTDSGDRRHNAPMPVSASTRLVSDTCTQVIERRAATVLVLRIEGHDVGEFGTLPMRGLEALMPEGLPVELFIDASRTRGATMHVSNDWSAWMGRHRERFVAIHMLTGSNFMRMTAEFVRRFAGLEQRMRLYSDPEAFEAALQAVAG